MLDAKTTGVAFMTPAATSVSDPEGAATLIETLNNVCDFMKWLLDKTKETKQMLSETAKSSSNEGIEAKKETLERL